MCIHNEEITGVRNPGVLSKLVKLLLPFYEICTLLFRKCFQVGALSLTVNHMQKGEVFPVQQTCTMFSVHGGVLLLL